MEEKNITAVEVVDIQGRFGVEGMIWMEGIQDKFWMVDNQGMIWMEDIHDI